MKFVAHWLLNAAIIAAVLIGMEEIFWQGVWEWPRAVWYPALGAFALVIGYMMARDDRPLSNSGIGL